MTSLRDTSEKIPPTLELYCVLGLRGAELIKHAGALALSHSLTVGHDEFIVRDIRQVISELNEALAAFDRAEPQLAARSALRKREAAR